MWYVITAVGCFFVGLLLASLLSASKRGDEQQRDVMDDHRAKMN